MHSGLVGPESKARPAGSGLVNCTNSESCGPRFEMTAVKAIGEPATTGEAGPVRARDRLAARRVKVASHVRSAVMVTLAVWAVPEQSPLQPSNRTPPSQ